MRILLPPSEAKRGGGSATGTDATHGPLWEHRAKALSALVALSATPGAADVLKLPARSAAEDLAANRAVRSGPVLPAIERYCGIVYEGLDVRSLTRVARRRADESVVIFSGLWGALGAVEPVPAYRLPASASLPGLGVMAAFWRPVLDEAMPALLGGDGLVVDLRSSDYAAMWRPGPPERERVVVVRVLSPRPGLEPAVVSHPSKLGKGRLAHELLSRRARVTRVGHLADAWRAVGGSAALEGPRGLDLVL
jgi:cytoplasmic iron level regulating protein YaaA (DUF328/UPF0246 family)